MLVFLLVCCGVAPVQAAMSDAGLKLALASGRISYEQPKQGDVVMVSFEQRWVDTQSTISIKNNTGKTIRAVKFRIVYLDMSGSQLDYADFEQIDLLEPGMAKKLNMPAYEGGRDFSYYKSERSPIGGQVFKVQFKALGVVTDASLGQGGKELTEASGNKAGGTDAVKQEPAQRAVQESPAWGCMARSGSTLWIVFVIGVIVGLYEIVAVMARNRHRSELRWILVSLVATPLFAAFLLLMAGESRDVPCAPGDMDGMIDRGRRW